jgi:lipoprotein-releasing system ATP-binding protein
MSSTAPHTVAPIPATTDAAILRASGVARTFKTGDARINVLKNVNVAIAPGEFVAIEGRSGSGKSTLLHILGALDSCNAGTVEFDGTDMATLSSAARAKMRNTHFGFVFQLYHLLPELNVLENTLLAPMIEFSWLGFRARRSALRKKATKLLAELGMDHRLKHRPAQLSGGERQRVAIARALMNEPRVLLADEPTGNLDYETGRQIMDLLESLHRRTGQTIVMVTHDRSLAREADRALILKDGQLAPA